MDLAEVACDLSQAISQSDWYGVLYGPVVLTDGEVTVASLDGTWTVRITDSGYDLMVTRGHDDRRASTHHEPSSRSAVRRALRLIDEQVPVDVNATEHAKLLGLAA